MEKGTSDLPVREGAMRNAIGWQQPVSAPLESL